MFVCHECREYSIQIARKLQVYDERWTEGRKKLNYRFYKVQNGYFKVPLCFNEEVGKKSMSFVGMLTQM